MLPTPSLSHFTEDDYEHIYEPAEDTFILLDALEQDADMLRNIRKDGEGLPLCVEIGSGSGCVSTFLQASVFNHTSSIHLCTDISPKACPATLQTAHHNLPSPTHPHHLDTIRTSLLFPLLRLHNQIDILLFNPPYVPTPSSEIDNTGSIASTWAGGADGMMAGTWDVLRVLREVLSDRGVFYLVAVSENRPSEILEVVRRESGGGVEGDVAVRRTAGREKLHVLRFWRRGNTLVTPMDTPSK
ncbi:S-adenosylmethionine-dependent methyltransferase [Saitoella coloradoensis]